MPNLSDPAAARRLDMFRSGGARVDIVGFRRGDAPPVALPAASVLELDVTHDGRMLQRFVATLKAAFRAHGWARGFARPDVIVARNLEMLAIANRLLGSWPEPPALVYECLDIHRLQLRKDVLGRSIRAIEQRLLGQASLLLTSSPAFLTNYFDFHGRPAVHLLENKVFAPGVMEVGSNPALVADTEPLRIGWFGALRCKTSLAALEALSRAEAGRVQVTLRGKPALTELEDFHATIRAAPHLDYAGTYRYPDDLATIYSAVHFVWAIDFFEAGQNSDWLLPNRLYEGCLHGAIPIALGGTQTAAFIERLGIGLVIPDIEQQTLAELFSAMTPERLRSLAATVRAQDPRLFRCEPAECVELVERLSSLTPATPTLELAA